MSFFNKLKQGVTDAGAKAINTVEANRLKAQVGKNNEKIHSLYAEIGMKVFTGYNNQQQVYGMVEEEIKQIHALLVDNKKLEIDIKAIWNQKECACGNLVALDAKFCSSCGHRFNLVTIKEQVETTILEQTAHSSEATQLLTEKIAVENGYTNGSDAQTVALGICPNCDEEIEIDSKFCGECGHMLS